MKTFLAAFLILNLSLQTAFAQTAAASSPSRQDGADPARAAEFERLNAEVVKIYAARKLEEALPLALSAVRAGEQTFGAQHPRLIGPLFNLAAVQLAQEKFGETEATLKRALAIYEQTPSYHALAADILDGLGSLRFRAKDYGEAEDYWARAVAASEKVAGPEGAAVAEHVFRLAEFHRVRTGVRKAGPLYVRAIRLWLKSPKENQEKIERAADNYHCSLINSALDHAEVAEAMEVVGRMRAEAEPKPSPGDSRPTLQGGVINGKALVKPQPDYPEAARRQRIGGAVAIKITVDEQGRVVEAVPMCAHPILMKAAQEAALRARFTPTTLNGVPVRVKGLITYRFLLR